MAFLRQVLYLLGVPPKLPRRGVGVVGRLPGIAPATRKERAEAERVAEGLYPPSNLARPRALTGLETLENLKTSCYTRGRIDAEKSFIRDFSSDYAITHE